MNSRELGADLTLAWEGAQIGVMGARQAVAVIEHRAIANGSNLDELADLYAEANLAVDVAAADGLVDEIVSPHQTRECLIRAFELHQRDRIESQELEAWPRSRGES